MSLLIRVALGFFIIAPIHILAQDDASVWFGNADGSPLEVQLGADVLIPVYVRVGAPPPVAFMDASIKLGVHEDYVTNITAGNVYSPFSEETGAWDGPFVQGQITSYEFTGECDPPIDNESHGTPELLMEFQVTISSDPSLVGQTVTALYEGYNPNPPFVQHRYTYFVLMDGETFTPYTYHSQLTIVDNNQNVPILSEWGMLIMGLFMLAIGTIAVVRSRKAAINKVF